MLTITIRLNRSWVNSQQTPDDTNCDVTWLLASRQKHDTVNQYSVVGYQNKSYLILLHAAHSKHHFLTTHLQRSEPQKEKMWCVLSTRKRIEPSELDE